MNSTIETNNALENKDAEYWIKEGRRFHLKDKNYKEAIKCYDKAIKLSPNDPSQLYRRKVKVFLDWGIALCKEAEIKQDENLFQDALKKYDEATKLKPIYLEKAIIFSYQGTALYGLAEIKQNENLYKEAVKYFIKSREDILSIFVLLYKNNKNRIFQPEHFYQLLDSDTNDALFFKSIEKDETKLNEYKDIYLRSIFIISQLHISNENEKLVAHYSKKEVSQKLVLDNDSKFRLNAINHSNDPTEGKTLLDFFYGKSDEKLNTEYEAFASCFTFNFDSLNLFRLYGKENGKEGTGLSLVFKENFFSREAEMSIDSSKADSSEINNDNSIKNEKFSLFRCIYIDPNPKTKQPIANVGRKEEYLFYREIENKFEKYNEEIDKIINLVRKEMNTLKKQAEKLNPTIIGQLLLNLRYLVKHIAFKEEQECRIVKIHPLHNNKEIKIEKDYNKMYIEYPLKISNHIDKIYFGPKTEDFELFKSMLKYKGLDIPCEKSENPLA